MADFSVPAAQIILFAQTLNQMTPLTPSPTPKGRYLCAKATPLALKAAQAHSEALEAFLNGAVTQDEDGKPIFKERGNQRTFDFQTEELGKQFAEIQAELIPLAGVRQMTRVELGDCPITIEQEMILISAGFLEDSEPA